MELPDCVRLGSASQSLLEHSSCLFETLRSQRNEKEESLGVSGVREFKTAPFPKLAPVPSTTNIVTLW